ncbi:hypothetical protein Tco_0970772 [Tanacetum coccineum]
MAEVELFILSEMPLDDKGKEGWTDEMLEFYEARITKDGQDGNEDYKRMKFGCAVEDEVGEDLSAHADFMTKNVVSNTVDASMADMAKGNSSAQVVRSNDQGMGYELFVFICVYMWIMWEIGNQSIECDHLNEIGMVSFMRILRLREVARTTARIALEFAPEFVYDSIDAVLLSSSDQVMHFEVKLLHDKRSFFVSFIYGENEPRDRLKLWDNLSEHMGLVNSRPWTMLGDLM